MIAHLAGHITDKQVNDIVDIIIRQYADYNRLINSTSFKSIFADEYAPHNRQFSVSWAISSGFPSQTKTCGGFEIDCLNYSKNFTRPILYNEYVKVLILNKTTHFKAHYLDDFYKLNDMNNQEKQLFTFFKFTVESNCLTNISLCFPNETGHIIEEEILLNKVQIIQRIAAYRRL